MLTTANQGATGSSERFSNLPKITQRVSAEPALEPALSLPLSHGTTLPHRPQTSRPAGFHVSETAMRPASLTPPSRSRSEAKGTLGLFGGKLQRSLVLPAPAVIISPSLGPVWDGAGHRGQVRGLRGLPGWSLRSSVLTEGRLSKSRVSDSSLIKPGAFSLCGAQARPPQTSALGP